MPVGFHATADKDAAGLVGEARGGAIDLFVVVLANEFAVGFNDGVGVKLWPAEV